MVLSLDITRKEYLTTCKEYLTDIATGAAPGAEPRHHPEGIFDHL
jgi:hypothetical protein